MIMSWLPIDSSRKTIVIRKFVVFSVVLYDVHILNLNYSPSQQKGDNVHRCLKKWWTSVVIHKYATNKPTPTKVSLVSRNVMYIDFEAFNPLDQAVAPNIWGQINWWGP